jgi:hypothetical protein
MGVMIKVLLKIVFLKIGRDNPYKALTQYLWNHQVDGGGEIRHEFTLRSRGRPEDCQKLVVKV